MVLGLLERELEGDTVSEIQQLAVLKLFAILLQILELPTRDPEDMASDMLNDVLTLFSRALLHPTPLLTSTSGRLTLLLCKLVGHKKGFSKKMNKHKF